MGGTSTGQRAARYWYPSIFACLSPVMVQTVEAGGGSRAADRPNRLTGKPTGEPHPVVFLRRFAWPVRSAALLFFFYRRTRTMKHIDDKELTDLLVASGESWVLAADPHILRKPGMWSGRTEINGDDFFALDQVIKFCLDSASNLILLGDTYDSNNNFCRQVRMVNQRIRTLIDAGLRVLHYDGNHETVVDSAFLTIPWLSLVDGTEYVHGRQFEILGMPCFALDYFKECDATDKLATIPPDTKVLFLHGTADCVMSTNYEFKVSDLPLSVRLVVSGHYHTPVTMNTSSGALLLYPGCLWATDYTMRHEKRVISLHRSAAGDLVVEPVQLRERPTYLASAYPVTTQEEVNALLLKLTADAECLDLPECVRKPIFILDTPVERPVIQAVAPFAHVYATKHANPGRSPVAADIEAGVDEDVPDDELLAMYVDREAEAVQFKFIMDILQNGAESAMETLRQQMGITQADSDLLHKSALETKV